MPVRIGTVDLPERPARIDRDQYFAEFDYLELSALFAGPLKAASFARWQAAPPGTLGLVAPWVVAQSSPPDAARLWHHDATVGAFRDSAHGRSALAMFHQSMTEVAAGLAVFRSPALHPPSTANRDQLRRFFAEIATEEAIGARRVWQPAGQWEPRVAVRFASEIGVICAIDPLVHDPGNPAETYEDLEAEALYFRVVGLSGALSSDKLEDLADLAEHYGGIDLTVAFASPARWHDARAFKAIVEGAG